MARLTSGARSALPASTFAGPDRSFPIPDASHARAALSMAHYASDPGAIRAKVQAKYPSIGQDPETQKKVRGAVMAKLKGKGK